MLRAMVVLMVPVVLIVGLYRFLGHEDPPNVDTSSAYGAAQAAHPYPVLIPTGLGSKWHVTTAEYAAGTLRVGLTSPDHGALQLVETNRPDPLPDELGTKAHVDGTADVNGTAWQRYVGGRPDEQALVLSTPGRTVIVVGKSSDQDRLTLARSLSG